jgi:hypothetical protein
MDKVTQSNAASAEESASASEELTAQAETMRESVRSLEALVGGSSGRGRPGPIQTPVIHAARAAAKGLSSSVSTREHAPLPPPEHSNGSRNGHGPEPHANGNGSSREFFN